MKKAIEALNAVVDTVLAYRPKQKTKKQHRKKTTSKQGRNE